MASRRSFHRCFSGRCSRRRLLGATAATAAAATVMPQLVPAAALGQGRTAPSNRVAVGMIGLGRQGIRVNLAQLLEMDDVQVVALCDVDSWRLEQARLKTEAAYAEKARSGVYKGCATCLDYRSVLARGDIDAVMISTPDHWHVPMAIAAMEAGKDVALEKPITRSIAEGRRLSEVCKKLGRVFRVDSEFRSLRSFHQAATLIRNGVLGQIKQVTTGVPGGDPPLLKPQPEMPVPPELDYRRWLGPAPHAPYTEARVHKPKDYNSRPGWMCLLDYCDGKITNWGSHLNDVGMWCVDLERTGPVEIEATGKYPPKESFWNCPLEFEVRYRFANGLQWRYVSQGTFVKVEGTQGWIYADMQTIKAEPASLLAATLPADAVQFPMKSDKRDFIDCVKTRQETLEPAEVGHRVTSMCLLGHIALQLGGRLRWDPQNERFLNSELANWFVDRPICSPPLEKS